MRKASFYKEESVVFRPIKHRFLKPYDTKMMQTESRTSLLDYAEVQLIFVQQRYNIGIAVVKYFGNYF